MLTSGREGEGPSIELHSLLAGMSRMHLEGQGLQ
jgi:hypothetical protein